MINYFVVRNAIISKSKLQYVEKVNKNRLYFSFVDSSVTVCFESNEELRKEFDRVVDLLVDETEG